MSNFGPFFFSLDLICLNLSKVNANYILKIINILPFVEVTTRLLHAKLVVRQSCLLCCGAETFFEFCFLAIE